MKFQTGDVNDIKWISNPEGYEVADVVGKIKDAGKWDTLLQLEADEDGVVDCDALYDRLRHEAAETLLSVGLHYTEATATVMEVVNEWAWKNKKDGLKVSYCEDGKTPSGLQLYDYGDRILGCCLEFECVNPDGTVEEVSLDADDVFELVKGKANGNANTGEWTCTDVETAVFEMWSDKP